MRSSIAPRPLKVLGLVSLLLAASCGVAVPTAGSPGGDPPATPTPGGGNDPDPGGGASTLKGGVLVTLVDRGEQFRIWVTEPAAAKTLVDISSGSVAFTNITGPLRAGSGAGQHNSPWSWHIDPARVLVNIQTFAPVYSEKPSVVEADLAVLLAAGSDKMTSIDGGSLVTVRDYR